MDSIGIPNQIDTATLAENFRLNGYAYIEQCISSSLVYFLYQHMLIHAQSPETQQGDGQVANAPVNYGAPLFDCLLESLRPTVETITSKKLWPTYSYSRLYAQGDSLSKHTDRTACSYSATLTLGYDLEAIRSKKPDYLWPIYMNNKAFFCQPGDLVIYEGCNITHWREPFEGQQQGQVFLHYIDKTMPYAKYCKYDSRPMLGLPESSREESKLGMVSVIAERMKAHARRK